MSEFSLHMPLWAILYCGLILASAAGTIMISGRKSPAYIFGELLSAVFTIMFFLFYYEAIPYPSSIMIVITMLVYILHQEIWINRELYGFLKDGTVPKEEQKFLFIFTAVFFTLFLSPLIWVLVEVFKHFL